MTSEGEVAGQHQVGGVAVSESGIVLESYEWNPKYARSALAEMHELHLSAVPAKS